MQEATVRGDLIVLGLRDAQDALVELGTLVIAQLTGLADRLAHVTCAEVSHVATLAAALAVLVTQEFDAEALD